MEVTIETGAADSNSSSAAVQDDTRAVLAQGSVSHRQVRTFASARWLTASRTIRGDSGWKSIETSIRSGVVTRRGTSQTSELLKD